MMSMPEGTVVKKGNEVVSVDGSDSIDKIREEELEVEENI